MLLEFSVVPIGGDVSLSAQVAKALDIIDSSGLSYRLGPMGTAIEGEWDEVMDVVKRCHEELLAASPRVLTKITIDDRPEKEGGRLLAKIRSVEEKLGRKLK